MRWDDPPKNRVGRAGTEDPFGDAKRRYVGAGSGSCSTATNVWSAGIGKFGEG